MMKTIDDLAVDALSRLTADIRRPYVVVLGGAKVADKFDAFGSLIAVADRILVGGAQGDKVGTSLLEASQVDAAADCLSRAAPDQIELPSDVIVAAGPDAPEEVVADGGDTGAAIRALGFAEDAFGYVSTGGGASLEFIRGKILPGLAVLEQS